MVKVYVVTIGEYSDARVIGVFSTGEIANEEAKRFGSDNVKEFTIDECQAKGPPGLYPYQVKISKNGDVMWVGMIGVDEDCELYRSIRFNSDRMKDASGNKKMVNWMNTYVWAKDETHAIKIANEKRTQIIALNKWDQEGLEL